MALAGRIKSLKDDVLASLVVFSVALPLCLGVALASGAPLFAGLVSGIVGGIVVSITSRSPLIISGPAVALAVVTMEGIRTLGGFEGLLFALILAGIIQLVLGFFELGNIALFFPRSVIRGVLAAIGIIIMIRQIPLFMGVDTALIENFTSWQADGREVLTRIVFSLAHGNPGVMLVGMFSLAIMVIWEYLISGSSTVSRFFPAPLIVVVTAISLNYLCGAIFSTFAISGDHLVSLPEFNSFAGSDSWLPGFDFAYLQNPQVYIIAITIVIIASIQNKITVEGNGRSVLNKNMLPLSFDLQAQGIGNFVSGLLGGLPMAALRMQSSPNIQAGGRTRKSVIIHGLFLALTIFALVDILEMIPLSALAAIMLVFGYKLCSIRIFRRQLKSGAAEFAPFMVTAIVCLTINLLVGIGFGLVAAGYFAWKQHYKYLP